MTRYLVRVSALAVALFLFLPLSARAAVPVGTIAMWFSASPPSGWLLLNGQSTAGYPELAAIYGANLPDITRRVPLGAALFGDGEDNYNYLLGGTGGEQNHQLSVLEMPLHYHFMENFYNSGVPGVYTPGYQYWQQGTGGYYGAGYTGSAGSDFPHNNIPPFLAVNFIVAAVPDAAAIDYTDQLDQIIVLLESIEIEVQAINANTDELEALLSGAGGAEYVDYALPLSQSFILRVSHQTTTGDLVQITLLIVLVLWLAVLRPLFGASRGTSI